MKLYLSSYKIGNEIEKIKSIHNSLNYVESSIITESNLKNLINSRFLSKLFVEKDGKK